MLNASFFETGETVLKRRAKAKPPVSIVMPVFGVADGATVATIERVLAQRWTDFELILIDDGTTDGVEDQLRDSWRADDRIVVLRFERKSGLLALRLNGGLLRAAGEFVGYQFAEARYLPDGLGQLMERAPKSDIIAGSCLIAGDETGSDAETCGAEMADHLAYAALIRRKALLDRAGLFDPHLAMRHAFARDYWGRIAGLAKPELIGPVAEGNRGQRRDTISFAEARMRSDRRDWLAPERVAACGLFDGSFIAEEADRLYFHSVDVLDFAEQNLSAADLAETKAAAVLMPGERTDILVEGPQSIRSPTRQMAFHNYAEVFPELVQVISQAPRPGAAGAYDTKTFGEPSRGSAGESAPAADIVVSLRTTRDDSPAAGLARGDRRPVIYAMDDNLLALHSAGADGNADAAAIGETIRSSDYVTVYSDDNAAPVAAFNPRVSVQSMTVPAGLLARAGDNRRARDAGPLRYVIIARVVRRREARKISEALVAFFSDHREDASLSVFVDNHSEATYANLFKDFPFERLPKLGYREFRKHLLRAGYDFIINPLLDNPLNRGKSPVKQIEAALAGAILITSPTPPYQNVVDGETGIVVRWRKGAWAAALEASLELPGERRSCIRRTALAYARRRFSTEANLIPFRAMCEAARVHALLGSRLLEDGIPAVLAAGFDREQRDALAELLSPHHFRVRGAGDLGADGADAAILRNNSVKLVLAASAGSPWVAAAQAAGIPSVAFFDGRPPGGPRPDYLLAPSHDDAVRARRAGFVRVVRWGFPRPETKTSPVAFAANLIRVFRAAINAAEARRLA